MIFLDTKTSYSNLTVCVFVLLMSSYVEAELTTVLTPCAASARPTMERLGQVVRMGNRKLIRKCHRPRSCPWVRQRGYSVLV